MKKNLSAIRTAILFCATGILLGLSCCNKPVLFDEADGQDSAFNLPPQKKILLISLQGAIGSVMKDADIPHIRGLLSSSIYSWDAVCDTVSTDQAGWACLFTGVGIDKNGITGTSYAGNHFEAYPSLLSRLKNANAGYRIVNISSDASLNDTLLGQQDADISLQLNTDAAAKDSAIERLGQDDPDALFVTFSGINKAGTAHGFSASSPVYVAAIQTADSYIGEIITALKNRKSYADEDWLIIVTSNHGGTATGDYGGAERDERNTFVLYSNKSFQSKEIKMPLVNVPYDGIYPFFYRADSKDHAAYTSNAAYHFGADQNFTIEFNIRTTYDGGDDHPVIANKNWGSGSNTGWVIYKQNGNIRINYRGDAASRIDMRDGPVVADGKWHHVSVTFDRQDKISIYMDGVFYVSGPSIKDNGNIDSGLPLAIGADGTLDYGYNGPNGSGDNYVSDIRVWNTVLTPAEIAQWAFQPVTKDHPDFTHLIGYWKANEGPSASNTIRDFSATAADLSIQYGLRWDTISDVLNPSNIDPTSFVPKSVDVVANVLAWMGIKIEPAWDLDGQVWILEN